MDELTEEEKEKEFLSLAVGFLTAVIISKEAMILDDEIYDVVKEIGTKLIEKDLPMPEFMKIIFDGDKKYDHDLVEEAFRSIMEEFGLEKYQTDLKDFINVLRTLE